MLSQRLEQGIYAGRLCVVMLIKQIPQVGECCLGASMECNRLLNFKIFCYVAIYYAAFIFNRDKRQKTQ